MRFILKFKIDCFFINRVNAFKKNPVFWFVLNSNNYFSKLSMINNVKCFATDKKKK